jgi:hypothetical protein
MKSTSEDRETWCSMCYSPGNKHEGGFEYQGKRYIGKFCSKDCFDLWVQWKVNFIRWCVK